MKKTRNKQTEINNLITRIDQLRSERGLSISALADKSNLSDNTLKFMFRRKSLPSLGTIYSVCSALNIEVWQLFFPEDVTVQSDFQQQKLLFFFDRLEEKYKNLLVYIAEMLK